MGDEQTNLLIVAADPDRTRRFAAWAPDRWVVGTARDGRAALRALDDVDVVVLAMDLPDRSGEGVLRELYNRGYECQVVAVTATDRTVSLADEVLAAPVDRSTYRATLDRAGDRVTYDERLREYYSLAARRAGMEARNSPEELAESEEYARLTERATRLRRRVDDLLEAASDDDFEGVFRGFFPGEENAGTAR